MGDDTRHNPRNCVVCGDALVRRTAAQPPEDDFEGLTSPADWDEPIVSIHCPRCQLLYRVVDPHGD